MSAVLVSRDSLAELLQKLGDVPPTRILARPALGTATAADVLRLSEGQPKRRCELVDGVLVQKAGGHREARLAAWLIVFIGEFLRRKSLGVLVGPDGPHLLSEGVIRFPDVAFIAWDRIPADADPSTPLPDWIPNLAVEVISPGNTPGEMQRKLHDYFNAGVELVWYIDVARRVIQVYHSAKDQQTLTENDELTGGEVLPGFHLSVRELFERADLRRPS